MPATETGDMDFRPSDEQRAFRSSVATFVDDVVMPQANRIDRTDTFPGKLVTQLGERGLMGMPFSTNRGGAGVDYHGYADGLIEISRGSGALGTIVAAHTSLASVMIERFGSSMQTEEYFSPLVSGAEIGAFALSESGAGSDVGSMKTTAVRNGDAYVISGEKQWISNGSVADTIILFAKTDPGAGNDGISSFIVRPQSDDGVSIPRTESKLGDRGCPTATIRLQEVILPADRRIGDEDDGFLQALKTLNGGRITIAARSIGLATAAFDTMMRQFDERGPELTSQASEHAIASMATEIQAAELLMHKAAHKRITGQSHVTEAAMAKLVASEVSRTVTSRALDLCGTNGMTQAAPLERYYRDAKLNEIYEGTSEILRNTIAARMLKNRSS